MSESKNSLSISQLNMLSRCGEQYYQRYVLGRKVPPAIAMIVGRAVDNSVGRNLSQKLERGELFTKEDVEDFAAQSFNGEWEKSDVMLSKEEKQIGLKVAKGQALDKTVRLAGLHAIELAPVIQPTHLQRKVQIELPNYPYDLIGFIDIQEGLESIRDTKTTGKSPAANIADKDDQLTIYAMMVRVMDGSVPDKLCLDYLVDLKKPKALTLSTTRDEDDFNPILRRIEAASLALEKGVFIPARESDWWCSPKWCGYWDFCPYTKKSKRPQSEINGQEL